MVREIEQDLGGRRQLTRIQGELIRAFAGAATTLQYLNAQVALGETSEIDLSGMRQSPAPCCGSARGSVCSVAQLM